MKFFLTTSDRNAAVSRAESVLREVNALSESSEASVVAARINEFNELVKFSQLLNTVEQRERSETQNSLSTNSHGNSLSGLLKEIRSSLKVHVKTPMHAESASATFEAFLREFCKITGLTRENAMLENMRKVKSTVLFHHSDLLGFEITENMFRYSELLKLNLKLRVVSSRILGIEPL
ncbi:p18 [Carnation yellow fleck virus]|uniref:p18 n=1 Tax=Carnation yellow fleck virus TaxID=940280 RepID=UPI0003C93C9B|nr:p18 [Carnation yellow fleck virus]ADV40945.1 p18 [Carnation yellow fleck virus]BBK15495.1 p18 [Carnation yellow fleck virus]